MSCMIIYNSTKEEQHCSGAWGNLWSSRVKMLRELRFLTQSYWSDSSVGEIRLNYFKKKINIFFWLVCFGA